jgi:hypothetical protein
MQRSLGIKMRTRGSESLYGGPTPLWRGKLHRCGPGTDYLQQGVTLSLAGGEKLDVLFTCEHSGPYNRVQIISQASTNTPTVRVDIFAADPDGAATGSSLANTSIANATAFTALEFTLGTPINLIEGQSYVARFTVTAGTEGAGLVLMCNAGNSILGPSWEPSGWYALGTFTSSTGVVQGQGLVVFAIITTPATGSKTSATMLGGPNGAVTPCYTAAGTYLRSGFAHTPTEDRMVYTIKLLSAQLYGDHATANTLSAFVYENRGGTWTQVFASIGKKHNNTVCPQQIVWYIPQGFALKRGAEYVVSVGPTADGAGSAANCMQIGKCGQYALFPRAQNVGQFGGISEEKQWPAWYNGSAPITFDRASTGTNINWTPVSYQYREVPTVVLP